MRDKVIEIVMGQEVLLLVQGGVFAGRLRDLQESGPARRLLSRLLPTDMDRLKTYWADKLPNCSPAGLADREVLDLFDEAFRSGQLHAIVLPRSAAARPPDQGTAKPSNAGKAAPGASAAPVGQPPAPGARAATAAPAPLGAPRPIAEWPVKDRVAEVVRRAAPKVPGDVGEALLSLLSPENLTILMATILFAAGANLTPYGWAADALLAAVAFAFGGLAAVHALIDLAHCFDKTSNATSDSDLDEAADALARAVVALGVAGLIAVLHRASVRKSGATTGSGAGQLMAEREAIAAARAERLQARHKAQRERARAEYEANAEAPASKFLAKKLGATEPGAAKMTPSLAREIAEGKLIQASGKGLTKDGWPPLSSDELATFKGTPKPIELKPGQKIYRVIDADCNPNGSYWSLDPPPQNEAAWRSGRAVKNDWNSDGMYVEKVVGPEGMKVWSGPARAQQSSDGVNALAGGQTQIWTPPNSAGSPSGPMPTPWNQ